MFKKIAYFYISIISFAFISSFVRASDLAYKEDELIVRFAPKAMGKLRIISEKNEILSNLGLGTIKHEYKIVPSLNLVKLSPGKSVQDALEILKSRSEILYAEPDYKIKLLSTFPNDPNINKQWGLHNTGQDGGTQDADIDAPEAWDITTTSDIIVAVLDTGIDYAHPDLAANMWINSTEANGIAGVDDDGNGYIDDIRGWDFGDNDSDPNDYQFHGTHVAGILGAVGNNGIGVTGVCWNVKMMNLKVFPYEIYHGFISDAISAINYAVDKGAKVLNNSWGGGEYSQSLKDAIDAADANGVLFIASAGNEYNNNDEYPAYPASYDCNNIISVMANDCNDNKSSFSNYGPNTVDLSAPGTDIFSTFPTFETYYTKVNGYSTYYETINGTSMATPLVSGACALLWTYYPDLNHIQIKEYILGGVDKLPYFENYCLSGGRLNLYNSYKPHFFTLTKQDDILDGNCVLPGSTIKYTITYNANEYSDYNVHIVDYLPEEVEPNDPCDPNYDAETRTYIWNIGTLLPDGNGTVSFTVRVNNLAEPLGSFINRCKIEGDHRRTFAETNTPVCEWNPGIIYVDNSDSARSGSNTGMSWKNAYWDLQKALDRAANDCGTQIWVAGGNYTPSVPQNDETFQIVNGVSMYGHFAGDENSITQRNLTISANESILNGEYLQGGYTVTASGLALETIFDGFTIPLFYTAVRVENSDLRVLNCIISGSGDFGMHADNGSNITVANCLIHNESSDGIYVGNSNFTITNCDINGNGNGNGINAFSPSTGAQIANNIIRNYYYGINVYDNRSLLIENNWIYHNRYNGIFIDWSYDSPVIRNDTIVSNGMIGIEYSGIPIPVITSSIVWGHTYADLYGCNASDSWLSVNGDPCFTFPDDNDFHLKPDSNCIDAGDPCFNDFNDKDIDGECRIIYGKTALRIDIGADEKYSSKVDYDHNNVVNFNDYSVFASSWLKTTGQPGYEPNCNFDGNSIVDIYDLASFCDDWLWIAPWSPLYQPHGIFDMDMMSQGSTESSIFAEEAPVEVAADVPAESNDGPMSAEQIQELIDWTEQLWQSNPELWETPGQHGFDLIMESLKAQLGE